MYVCIEKNVGTVISHSEESPVDLNDVRSQTDDDIMRPVYDVTTFLGEMNKNLQKRIKFDTKKTSVHQIRYNCLGPYTMHNIIL